VDAALAGGQKQKRGHGKAGAENNFRFWMHQFHLPGTRKRAPQSERTLTWALGDRCRHPPESNSEIVPGPRCPFSWQYLRSNSRSSLGNLSYNVSANRSMGCLETFSNSTRAAYYGSPISQIALQFSTTTPTRTRFQPVLPKSGSLAQVGLGSRSAIDGRKAVMLWRVFPAARWRLAANVSR